MVPMLTDPIADDWLSPDSPSTSSSTPVVTAKMLSDRLGRLDVTDVDPQWLPEMAAAATELARAAGRSLHFGHDDPPVALLRMIARATQAVPAATGPHTTRLFDVID